MESMAIYVYVYICIYIFIITHAGRGCCAVAGRALFGTEWRVELRLVLQAADQAERFSRVQREVLRKKAKGSV